MITIRVVWWSDADKPEVLNRGYWDQGLLESVFSAQLWDPVGSYKFEHHSPASLPQNSDGAIVIIPSRWFVSDVPRINDYIKDFKWCLVILTGDEEGVFPWKDLQHDNVFVWVQTPHPEKHKDVKRKLGDYWPPQAPGLLRQKQDLMIGRTLNWFFSGQETHVERQACVRALTERLQTKQDGVLNTTKIFGSGMEYDSYMSHLANAKFAITPSGAYTPDTFRLFEALEAGCIPIASATAPRNRNVEPDYWTFLFDGDPSFPTVHDWSDFDETITQLLPRWLPMSNRIYAWWQQHKRDIAYWLVEDITVLRASGGIVPPASDPELKDLITILVPTSPVPGNPDASHLEEVISSIRNAELVDCEIIVMIDGVRPEQEARAAAYDEYTQRVLQLCNFEWHNVLPVIFDKHTHQANMTKRCLDLVRTPTVLFVEHDTPLVGSTDWMGLIQVVTSGTANVIRLHHEASILEPHRPLMLDGETQMIKGVPLMRTAQWSQRPHIALKDWYRWMLDTYFGSKARTMIEDTMHGVVYTSWKELGQAGWDPFKLWIYAPPGDMKRSTHIDARGSDPKWEMSWQYDGPVPLFAPHPTRDERR